MNGARASRENRFYNRTAATSSFHKYKKPTKTILPEATSIDFHFIRWQPTWAFPFPVKFAYIYICILREQIGHEKAEIGFWVKPDYTQKETKISIFLLQSNTQGFYRLRWGINTLLYSQGPGHSLCKARRTQMALTRDG